MVFGGVAGFLTFLLFVYCIFDVIASDEALIRNLHKILWLLIVIFIPLVGSVAWLALGRPLKAGLRPGDTSFGGERRGGDVLGRRSLPRPPRGPDDSPEFIESLEDRAARLRQWEEDLKRREEDLRRKEEGEQ
jgi:hypothetical protein